MQIRWIEKLPHGARRLRSRRKIIWERLYGGDEYAWYGFQECHRGDLKGYPPVRGDAQEVRSLLIAAGVDGDCQQFVRELAINPPGDLTFTDCYDIAEAMANGYRARLVASWYGITEAYVKQIARALNVTEN